MRKLSPQGEQSVNEIAQRYGVSFDAIATMLNAVANGGGTMAQFSHPEFGGSGQWMQGGMTMVGDMFNHGLKAQVDNVCYELSGLLANTQPFAPVPVRKAPAHQQNNSFQSQSQGNGFSFYMTQGGAWWPEELGQPSATGSQNDMQYAYFPNMRRLALNAYGSVGVYDTLDHNIGGFGQQQSGDASITFSSQYGIVSLNSLPRVDNVVPKAEVKAEPSSIEMPRTMQQAPNDIEESQQASPVKGDAKESDIFELLERLAGLRDAKVISEDDFEAKKQDILARI
ncbi:SHOCT domain-containing protein [Hirschia baltica]|uniref:SHOCT domain-containing protein n=1 Tax=Hirschia baltica (strain ATCC 49814 / DSM 5838 / IFAM 1418) TaxID=582402 RepID=C6XNV1_HIRBI|nr:SHOCT domain-containing protein [Hirschia baltica]ACT58354.1 conserved hypothetical protein [Hirschia baltica ATCC 49814]